MQLSRLPFELLVGLRYVRARRTANKNGFISFISLASVLGIGLGVAALIIVLSVMNGFQKEVRDRMLSVVSHIEVFGASGSVDNWQQLIEEAKRNKRVVAGAPYVEAQAMLVNGDVVRGAVIRGIKPEFEAQVSSLTMKGGQLTDLKPGDFNVVLGLELARALGVRLGDKVTLIAPSGSLTPAGVIPRLKQFTVSGVFESGHFEYDSGLALVAMEDAQKLFRVDGATGVRLKTTNLYEAPEIAEELSHTLTGDLLIRDWGRINRSWFAAVQVEKRMMFIILSLIVAVAAFNLVSMLVMMVTDKRADIAILRTQGASPRSIQKIFMIAGSISGSLGTLVGALVGIVTALNIPTWVPAIEHLLGVQILAKDIYFINSLPSDPQAPDIIFITVISLVLSFLATLYPSWRAARIQPAEALRYE
ncbi:MAG TPA: lipoprotein-releasing ABC transporter permease subunit [Burkholderiales bacterium]|jgi:lipoprotein-releasing system permease protein